MSDIKLSDVTIHVDETMDSGAREKLEAELRTQEGVISVHTSEKTPHLLVVTYDPEHTRSREILNVIMSEHLHAELIGI